jgi:molybdopterin/thiamine biosynthesis adenylyltransferase
MRTGEGAALSDKRVAVLGCGSLGAGVAKLLLQSGVGNLLLIDPDKLEFMNISRHELGADSEGRNKAIALAERFRQMFPHAREVRGEPFPWQELLRRDPDAFKRCDLILSLTGNWNAESALNDLQRSETDQLRCTIVYGWLEEQACAAHALAIAPQGACLRCGFGPTGTIDVPATICPPNERFDCGAATSVYGAIGWCQSNSSGRL